MSTPPDYVGLPLEKPVRELNQILDIDLWKGFAGSIRTVLGLAIDDLSLTVDGVREVVRSGSLVRTPSKAIDDPGKLAWLLIHEAMIRGVDMLLSEKVQQLQRGYGNLDDPPSDVDAGSSLKAVVENAFAKFEDTVVTIDSSFFERPKELGLISEFKNLFAQLLQSLGQSKADATNIADRFPSYFVYGLIQEWRAHSGEYGRINEAIKTPFTEAAERNLEWREYRAFLQQQIDEPVFDESFSLRQIYVEPRAYFVRKKEDAESPNERIGRRGIGHHSQQETERVVVPLTEELQTWVQRANKNRAVRVICGGPGIGKSSFTKMFAARIAEAENVPVLFIPLHRFDLTGDLEDSVASYVRDAGILSHNPLHPEHGEQRLLIIFDGLDELSQQGKTGAAAAKQFVNMVQRRVDRYNTQTCRVQALISGRNQVIEENESLLRKERQVLHVLPYLIPQDQEQKDRQDLYVYDNSKPSDELFHIGTDQRPIWWKKYSTHSTVEASGFPEELQDEKLEEITSQPLLNYLVALSYKAGRIDFSNQTTLNEIYRDLLTGVYERKYATGGTIQVHPSVEELSKQDFIELLEEVALTAWHQDGRTTSIGAVMDRCEEDTRLKRNFEAFQDTVRDGITQLVLAFFFRQHSGGEDRDKTFEFTHKSFAEYLTARRLVRTVSYMSEAYQDDLRGDRRGRNARECLEDWLDVAGQGLMDEYVLQFVQDEVRLRHEHRAHKQGANVGEWQESLVALVNSMLRKDLPVEKLTGVETFKERRRIARDANESLFCILAACAGTAETVSAVEWPSPLAAYEWVKRMQAQTERTGRGQWTQSMRWLNLSEPSTREDVRETVDEESTVRTRLVLNYLNLGRANLSNSCLTGSKMSGTSLTESTMAGADLRDVDFLVADLRYANLGSADLRGADLRGANLGGVNLGGADLDGANLRDANLGSADLGGADLGSADLRGANLGGANLLGADLRDAILLSADLRRADLGGTDLGSADLRRANFRGADLGGADLHRANLLHADLDGANVEPDQLVEALFDDSTIMDASLREEVERLRQGNSTA